MKLSIVTTLYKSEATIEEFVRRASAAAAAITDDYEIVIVDDGSPDDSLAIAVGLAAADPHLKVVELSRNFGHHKALMTGLKHASGDYCFLIDSDLEEPPELLAEFWAHAARDRTGRRVRLSARSVGRSLQARAGAVAYQDLRLAPFGTHPDATT